MIATCNCYACRNYYTECTVRKHPKKEMIAAKHNKGYFWWGLKKAGRGPRVKICVWCRDALSEEKE